MANITTLSFSEIGRPYGKDHSTVTHGKKTIGQLSKNNEHVSTAVSLIGKEIDKYCVLKEFN